MNADLALVLLSLSISHPCAAQVVVAPPVLALPDAMAVQEAPQLPGLSAASDSSLSGVLSGIGDFPLLSREEEVELAAARDAGDKKAADKLVTSNLRLVVSIAKDYRGYGVSFPDLVQSGNEGLVIGAKKFDATKGNRVSTYVSFWIRACILRHIQDNFHLGRVLTNGATRKLYYSLRHVQGEIEQLHGPELANDPDFIATFMAKAEQAKPEEERSKTKIRPQDVQKMLELLGRPLMSLDNPLPSDDGSKRTFVDVTPSDLPRPDDLVVEHRRARVLAKAVEDAIAFAASRNPRYAEIIRERLMADEPATLKELGDRWGVSRERARQLEAKAIELLRQELEQRLDGTGELE